MFKWFKRKVEVPKKEDVCLKTLIYVYDTDIQKKVLDEYGIRVPLWMVFCTKDKIINSHLYFEMWSDKEFIE